MWIIMKDTRQKRMHSFFYVFSIKISVVILKDSIWFLAKEYDLEYI